MNEVRMTQATASSSLGSSSSKGGASAADRGGKVLPEASKTEANEQASQAQTAQKVPQETLLAEVEKVNDYVQTVQRDLEFSVDEDLDRTVIKVVDSDSGDLIRQIPEDIFLELARRLKEDGEMNLLNALG